MDAKTAGFNWEIEETIFMRKPPGYEEKTDEYVCRLNKSLYGLKQSTRSWNQAINKALVEIKCVQSKNNQCLYFQKRRLVWI